MTGSVKAQVEGEISKMKADFKAYQIDMAAKKKALHPSGPPPPSVSMPSANNGQALMHHLQQEKREEQTLKLITKKNQVQSAIEELLAEVRVRDWQRAEDAQVQQAMRKVRDWES
jgi:peptide subunit release factor 1 (eRF1)